MSTDPLDDQNQEEISHDAILEKQRARILKTIKELGLIEDEYDLIQRVASQMVMYDISEEEALKNIEAYFQESLDLKKNRENQKRLY